MSTGGLTGFGGTNPSRGLAMLASEQNFNNVVGNALSAAFGGNVVPGPISNLVDRLGGQFDRAGMGNISSLLPNYNPFSDSALGGAGGVNRLFGPSGISSYLGNTSATSPYLGSYRAQSYVDPLQLNLGHHNNPYFPGGVNGGNAAMFAELGRAITALMQITRNNGYVGNGFNGIG